MLGGDFIHLEEGDLMLRTFVALAIVASPQPALGRWARAAVA